MPKPRYWNGSTWVYLDASDSDTVDAKHASDFALASHTHTPADIGAVSKAGDVMTGVLKLPDGTASTPALAFASDADLGIFRAGTDIIALVAGGVEQFRVDTSGPKVGSNVVWHAGNDGSGSGLDADLLDGVHLSALPQLSATNTFTGTNLFKPSSDSTTAFRVQKSDASAVFSIDTTNRRVGILTESPSYTLDVSGAARFAGQITSTVNTGTAPFSISSTTTVTNLNADMVDGLHASDFVAKSIVAAKGDLIVATASGTVSRLGVGTNGQVLIADSAQTTGVKWGDYVPPIVNMLFRYVKANDMTVGTGATLTTDSSAGSGYCITITQPSSGATDKVIATYQITTSEMLKAAFSASVRLKSSNTSSSNVATITVYYSNDGTNWTSLTSTTLKGTDFPLANTYYTFPIMYEVQWNYIKFEVKALAVNSLTLAVDYILIQPAHGALYS